jgi:excisionase family DNA binding protein
MPRLTLADVGETVTRKQAAEILGCGEWALYTAIKRREVPTIPIGRRILIPKSYLEEVLGRSASQRVPGSNPGRVAGAREDHW